MNAQSTFSIRFWLLKSRSKNGKAPLFARVTINGRRAEISTQMGVSPLEWDAKAQKAKGKGNEAKLFNDHLAILTAKLLGSFSRLEAIGGPVAIEAFIADHSGIIERPRMLLEIVQ